MRRADEIRANLGRALNLVRGRQATSRRGLADQLHLSPTTAGEYVENLIGRGYVRETGAEKASLGRPTRSLAACPEAGWFAGVEFNADRVQAVRLDFAGAVTGATLRPLAEPITARAVLKEVARAIDRVARGAAGPLLALGVGAPGIVDPERGLGLDYAFVPDWRDVPVADRLAERFDAPVVLENNLRAIAYAERWLGGGRQLQDYVILGPRSGFGIAIVIAGRVHAGSHHAAGEIGRWPFGGAELHDALSAPAVWRRLTGSAARTRIPADLRQAVVAAAARHPRRLATVADDYADVIGRLHLLLDAEAYFLHGPLTALGAPFCDDITRRVGARIASLGSRPPVIRPSGLGDDAGAIGAACHAMERWAPAIE
jgi:predicted NBD/HSP70 family sugar kinase